MSSILRKDNTIQRKAVQRMCVAGCGRSIAPGDRTDFVAINGMIGRAHPECIDSRLGEDKE